MQQALVGVRLKPGAPAVLVRTGEPRDLDLIAETHHQRAVGYRFSLEYDSGWLQYALAKKRMLSGLGPPGTRDVEFFVCEEGTRAVAWVLLQVGAASRRQPSRNRGASPRAATAIRRVHASARCCRRWSRARPVRARPSIHAWWPARLDPVQLALYRRKVSGSDAHGARAP